MLSALRLSVAQRAGRANTPLQHAAEAREREREDAGAADGAWHAVVVPAVERVSFQRGQQLIHRPHQLPQPSTAHVDSRDCGGLHARGQL